MILCPPIAYFSRAWAYVCWSSTIGTRRRDLLPTCTAEPVTRHNLRMQKSILILAIACAGTVAGMPVDQKDVAYAHPGGKPVLLDVHIPDGPGPFPAAILVHGGGFDQGSKSTNVRP